MTPHISIVMAAKNYARFLPVAVESAIAQTYANWELIIIDDGSSDDTPLAVKPYLHDSRIRYLRSDKLGQSRAKNLGIAMARGEFIAFLDADDAWLPTKLERQLALFTRPDVGVVFSLRELIDENGNRLPNPSRPLPPRGRVLDAMFVQNFVCFSSAIVRRCAFEQVGRFDPRCDLSIDYDLWLRVAKQYAFEYVPEPLVLYRTGHGNLSSKLADRVATAFSIMHNARDGVSPAAIAHGYASTWRTLGWVMRGAELRTALACYWRALAYPHRRIESARGLVSTLVNWLRGRRPTTAAENLTINR